MVLLSEAKLFFSYASHPLRTNPTHSAGIKRDKWASATRRYWPFPLIANSRASEKPLSPKPDSNVVSVHTEAAARYEIHFGRCGVLLLCHELDRAVREALARDFHRLCPEPFIVSVLAHERDHYPAQTHACVLHSHDLSHLVITLSQQLAA